MATTITVQSLYRNEHHTVPFTASQAQTPGNVVAVGDGRLGIVAGLQAMASGDPGALYVTGQFDLKKNSTSDTFAVGASVYFSPSAGDAKTAPASGYRYAGKCVKASASGDTYVYTDLNVGLKLVAGQLTTVTAADTVITGLATVVAVVATLDSDPIDNPEWVTATIGDQAGSPAAGSVIIKTWQNTGGTDPTPAAATTFGKKVNWLAIGV